MKCEAAERGREEKAAGVAAGDGALETAVNEREDGKAAEEVEGTAVIGIEKEAGSGRDVDAASA
jgi:hypothetical protein